MTPLTSIIVWLTGLIVWGVVRQRFGRRANKAPVAASYFGWTDKFLLALSWLGLLLIPGLWALTNFPARLDRHFSPGAAWLGLAVDVMALFLFYRSHRDLGASWSVTLQIREQHALRKDGVYRLIRHPMYASFFLLGLAQLLLLPNWFAGATGLVAVSMLYGIRVKREEQMMTEHFGESYRIYENTTKRLIPWIL